MNAKNINQAMLNRANMQYEYKTLNNRIDGINTRVNGVDVVFRELTSGAGLNNLFSSITSGTITNVIPEDVNVTLYESAAQSSYIKNLRPSGQWESFFTSNAINYHTYSPMMAFIDMGNNGILFNVTSQNIGGDIMNMLPELNTGLTTAQLGTIRSAIISAGEESQLSLNELYYAQVVNNIISEFPEATIDHFTLHFE